MPFESNGPFKVIRIAWAHVMNAADFRRLLVVATRDTMPGHVYRMLWETGRAGVVLGGIRGSREHLTVQGPPPLTPRLKKLPKPIAESSSSRCVVTRLRLRATMP